MDLHLVVPNSALNFGETTWDLEEKFEPISGKREFIPQEHFSLAKPERLGGLREVEIRMIEQLAKLNHQLSAVPSSSEIITPDRNEILKEFSSNDGYLEYFAHGPSQRQFVTVGHFPGDNENGAIFEVRVHPGGMDLLGLIAKVDDGHIVMTESGQS